MQNAGKSSEFKNDMKKHLYYNNFWVNWVLEKEELVFVSY